MVKINLSSYTLTLTSLCLFALTGCTLFNPRKNYYYRPTIADRAVEKNIILNGDITEKPKSDSIKISDVDVFTFMYDLKQAWRQRSQSARVSGALGGVSAIGLAAAATTVAATHGGTTAGNTVPILTGIGTFIGELFGLVDPSGRDEAYKDGIQLLLDAEAEYCETLVKMGNCNANGGKMTEAGATLLKRTNAAIVVVDKALEGRVPTQAQIEAATAKFKKELPKDDNTAQTPPPAGSITAPVTPAVPAPKK